MQLLGRPMVSSMVLNNGLFVLRRSEALIERAAQHLSSEGPFALESAYADIAVASLQRYAAADVLRRAAEPTLGANFSYLA